MAAEAYALLALVPLVGGAAVARLSGPVSRRSEPAVATVLLTTLALTVALVTGLMLCLIGIVGLAQLPLLAGLGHWSPEAMRAQIAIDPVACLAGGVVATCLLASACLQLARVRERMREASAVAAAVPATRELAVVSDDSAFAFAVPGRPARVVVSDGLLARLTAVQRRVLLAHEFAHLRHRHHLYVRLGRLAAAANPLMRPVARAIELTVERWADETAVREVGDRNAVAGALAAAAFAAPRTPAPEGTLAGAQSHLPDRVASLLRPRASRSVVMGVAVATVVLACWAAGLLVIGHVHGLMELAEPV